MLKKLFFISLLTIGLAFVGTAPTKVSADSVLNDDNVFINNVDDPISIEGLKVELQVRDYEDGNLIESVYVILDNYTPNIDSLGDYIVVFGVVDSGDIESTIAITVRNVDVNAPLLTVEVESTLNIPQYSHLSLNLPNITANDSFEGNLTPDIEITGLELIDTEVLGSYSLIYTVSDSTGNQTSETFTVSVVDSTNPELSGPSKIIKKADTILDSTFYLQYFSASDDHDGIISNRIEVITDGYVGNANNPGTYNVVVSVSDTQGNFVNKALSIKVVSNMIPRLIIDNYYWVVPNDHKITDDEFINILKSLDDLPNNTYIFTTTYDNYSNSHTTLDTYQKNFSLLSSTGEEYEREIILEIVDSGANIVAESPGFVENNGGYIIGGIATLFIGVLFIIGVKKS